LNLNRLCLFSAVPLLKPDVHSLTLPLSYSPTHTPQNKQGQSPAHFAIAYKFYDLSSWLFENGADDMVTNKSGLTPYDGLGGDDDEDD